MFDLLIKNGFVIDGSGQNRTKSDIGITGEKISFIGDSKGKESKESINVDGKTYFSTLGDKQLKCTSALCQMLGGGARAHIF